MNYSFTERKRVRKSFAKRVNNHQVPYLIATQLESYAKFLQAEKPPMSRLTEGLTGCLYFSIPNCVQQWLRTYGICVLPVVTTTI